MRPFQYIRPKNVKEAVDMVSLEENARFIAGGTNLVDLMKRNIETPDKLVDITHLPLKKIEYHSGTLRIGALALNSDVAEHAIVNSRFPLLAKAIDAGASGQLRNMATVGGNLLQRTRCAYFYDTAFPCNKRQLETGCAAVGGINRMHAIFGLEKNDLEKSCIAVHPSDMCVALAALDAIIITFGPKGERKIPIQDFHRLPGNRPDLDSILEKGELILAVELKSNTFQQHTHYLKIRDRAAYAFAIVSAAVALDVQQDQIRAARVALGGVAHKPWRLFDVEKALAGKPISQNTFRNAAAVSVADAKTFEHNAFKIKLLPNVILEALMNAAGLEPSYD
ncbi:FAD binding domain-containing protein [Dyadobacter luticola]|uniref:Xanthine dehydrogenase family protein subunit M n=1 Tax=Dyadobacter luticola TaxID=1979387 RepID=A0A5R9L117_9BACT|nr:xanthine dehydrogenase family protein subunit M [Dyadobacter luticola]TLV02246.1 xanthine dehydrogenase family protein subunit M [Dyadobacter luticola]